MSAELSTKMGLTSKLVDVGRGRFEVLVGSRVIFSKGMFGRYPRDGELVRMLRETFSKS